MRVACISDTHLFHQTTKKEVVDKWMSALSHCDAVVHAGDFTYKGTIEEIHCAAAWFRNLQPRIKIATLGNHDWLGEKNPTKCREFFKGVHLLLDEGIEIEGKKFYGSPASPRFYDWAFNYDRGPVIRKVWDKIPSGLDMLITHGPAAGYGCYMDKGGGEGCHDLLRTIEEKKPRYHLCGHFHLGYGVRRNVHTTFINAALLNDKYQLAHHPIIVDI